jgi:hypothetical protein
MRRPSPALVVAVIALIAACAGSAGAARALITSKDVKDHSLRGRDIRSNTITGRNVKGLSGRDIIKDGLDGSDIDEATLDTVPNATHAGSATSAGSAAVAGALKGVGLNRLSFRAGAGTPATGIYDDGGLRIQAACGADGTLTASATPSGSDGGHVRVVITHPGSPAETTYISDDDFSGADAANLVTGGATGASGRLTFTSAGGDAITVDYLAQDRADPARGYACLLSGTAIHLTP